MALWCFHLFAQNLIGQSEAEYEESSLTDPLAAGILIWISIAQAWRLL
jgi:hypothetical protein